MAKIWQKGKKKAGFSQNLKKSQKHAKKNTTKFKSKLAKRDKHFSKKTIKSWGDQYVRTGQKHTNKYYNIINQKNKNRQILLRNQQIMWLF